MLAWIDSESEVNAMTPVYVLKLGLKVCLTNIKAQKVDSSTLQTFGMVLAAFRWKISLEGLVFSKKPSWWLIPV